MENKQLAEELRVAEENKFREQMMNSRLRRIEQFVASPTPPPISTEVAGAGAINGVKASNSDSSIDLPSRTAGPADYTHLADTYREQRSLILANESRINVLRGQQQKKLIAFTQKKHDELDALEKEQEQELTIIDQEFDDKEKALQEIFNTKRAVLEFYWYKQALFEQQKKERATGLKYQFMPLVTVVD